MNAAYAEAACRSGGFYLQTAVRYESTGQDIVNYQPSPITNTTNFAAIMTDRCPRFSPWLQRFW